MIARHVGQISLVLALYALVPAILALTLGEYLLGGSIVLGALLPSLLLALLARRAAPAAPIQANEAMIVTVAAFVLAAAFMVTPLHLAGIPLSDAVFEATSGVTTTGLTTRPGVEQDSAALGFLRAWMQFFGGLGFAALALALLAGYGAESRRLHDPSGADEDLATSIRIHARRILIVYAMLAIVGTAALWLAGFGLWHALLHTMTTVSTGGFSTFDASLALAPAATRTGVALLALAASMPLVLYYQAAARRRPALLWRDPELRAMLVAVTVVSLLLAVTGDLALPDALFQAINAQTTTGFSSVDTAGLSDASKLVLILSMATGAGLGSTGGGIKLLRLLVLARLVQLLVLRAQLPRHGVAAVRLGKNRVDDAQIALVGGVVALYAVVIVLSWAAFVTAGQPPLDALFEVVSATATVGLSVGISGPDLAPWLKAVLCFDMLAGRLEVLALLVALSPRNWLRRGS